MPNPTLTFFCELETAPLEHLFENPDLLDQLRRLKAGISLAILDFSSERARIVQTLNQTGIPLKAWLLLPKTAGYWFNAKNSQAALACYDQFHKWSQTHSLKWAAVGLNFQPSLKDKVENKAEDKTTKSLSTAEIQTAEANYRGLISQINHDGYQVETYILPYILDERRAGSTLLRRMTKLVDIPVAREICMLYTNRMLDLAGALLWDYAATAQAVAVGVTGGGVDLPDAPSPPPLPWSVLTRDLRLASAWSNEIYIFSLEGCVEQATLPDLIGFDWSQTTVPPARILGIVRWVRRQFQLFLKLSARPLLLTGGLLGGLGLILGSIWLWRWLKRIIAEAGQKDST